MLPASKTLQAVTTVLISRTQVNRITCRGDFALDDHTYGCMRAPPTLDADILLLIVRQLREDKTSLTALASCSHALRQLAAPVLFHNCRLRGERYPEAIRPYVRKLRWLLDPDDATAVQRCLTALQDLPNLTDLSFVYAMRIPWAVMKSCLTHPRIRSLSFDTGRSCLPGGVYPADEIAAIPISLSRFSFTTRLWRRVAVEIATRSESVYDELIAAEVASLAPLVPRLSDTVEELTLPMDSTPILSMIDLSWPRLQKLSFHGSYADATQMEALPRFISRLPLLRDLSMTVRQWHDDGRRAPILGRRTSPDTIFQPAHISLRSLIVAYPDPEDDIFSVDTTDLFHLSLRDWPRNYGNFSHRRRFVTGSPAPILTNAECLSILRRMDLPRLTKLELVYRADPGGADDELLSYISRTYPDLAHLQVHRYRTDREEYVDCEHIARLLTAARSLRTIRLNLDLDGDHGPYCNFIPEMNAWLAKLKDEIGPRLIAVLQDCPLLECCELLYHGPGGSTWVELRPAHLPEPHFIQYHDEDVHLDSPPMPYQLRFRRARQTVFRAVSPVPD